MEILNPNQAAELIVDLFDTNPTTSHQIIGAMEIHAGRHPQRGHITVIVENRTGAGAVFPTPRPMLTLAQVKTRAA